MNKLCVLTLLYVAIVLSSCTQKKIKDRFAYEIFQSKDTIHLLEGDTTSPIFTTDYFIVYPVELCGSERVDSIQNLIKNLVFNNQENRSFSEEYRAKLALYKEEYYSNKEFYEQEKELGSMLESMNFSSNIRLTTQFFNKFISVFSLFQTSYMGGAHGSYANIYLVVDNLKGLQIKEQDLFVDDYEQLLSRILTAEIVNQNPNINFFHDSKDELAVKPNGNFYLSKGSITFLYNVYEVAPYSDGTVEVVLRYDDIADLLSEQGKIWIEKF